MSNARYSIFAARAVFDVENVTATELRVLAALGTYANDEGWCYPNQTTLAERLKLTRQTISGAIKKLVEKGYVETEVRTAKGRGKVGYNYRVVLDLKRGNALPKADDERPDIGEGRQRPMPTTAAADFGADRDPMSAQASVPNKDSTNPSERPQQSSSSNEDEDIRRKQREAYEAMEREKAGKPKGKGKAKGARKRVEYTPEFNAIWLSWPANRRANSDKQKAFARYLTGAAEFGHDAVAAAAKHYLASPGARKENHAYCCLVEVFMNGKLEAAVEAAREAGQPREMATQEEAEHRAARKYFEAKGKWPQGYHPPEVRA